MKNWKDRLTGIVLTVLLGVIALIVSALFPDHLSSIMVALFLGMAVGNTVRLPSSFDSGINYSSSKLLEWAIVFLAFSIEYSSIASLGASSFVLVGSMMLIMLVASYYLSKRFRCPGTTGLLIGFGTTVCGSSAIAALAPSVSKEKEDIGIAMAVVNLLGTIGMLALPFVLLQVGSDEKTIGLMIGGSLHSVGNVAGAAYSIGDGVGELAITIKLARVAMLSPALILMNFLVNRDSSGSWMRHFKLPWYLWTFVVVTILMAILPLSDTLLQVLHSVGKAVLVVAMAGIGLKISIKKLVQSGKKGLVFGVVVFVLQVLVLLGLMQVL
ncbi:MAG: hypothetical protein RL226_1752 [Bacteroidota bacterium]